MDGGVSSQLGNITAIGTTPGMPMSEICPYSRERAQTTLFFHSIGNFTSDVG